MHLTCLLDRVQQFGLTVNPAKCQFSLQTIDFLGHLITLVGITPLTNKVEAIKNFPKPSTTKGIQKFLEMVNFYHRFLPGMANLMQPLFSLIRLSDKTLQWMPETMEAFHTTKSALAKAMVLAHPDPTSPWPSQWMLQTELWPQY
ncbi:uncharacterized protein [Narcine bancroftii]|uniref:uncharacterized protein n=1 Tax=Narcine bancroftii TaxID=1343680 RepID=UPI0038317F2E